MSGFARSQEYVDALVAADIPATADPRSVTVPGVLFEPPGLIADIGCGWTAAMQCVVIVPGPFNSDAWSALDALIAQVEAIVPATAAEPTEVEVDTGNNPARFPAYRLTWTETI